MIGFRPLSSSLLFFVLCPSIKYFIILFCFVLFKCISLGWISSVIRLCRLDAASVCALQKVAARSGALHLASCSAPTRIVNGSEQTSRPINCMLAAGRRTPEIGVNRRLSRGPTAANNTLSYYITAPKRSKSGASLPSPAQTYAPQLVWLNVSRASSFNPVFNAILIYLLFIHLVIYFNSLLYRQFSYTTGHPIIPITKQLMN